MRAALMVLAVMISLPGCTTMVWRHATAGPEQFRTDRYECRRETYLVPQPIPRARVTVQAPVTSAWQPSSPSQSGRLSTPLMDPNAGAIAGNAFAEAGEQHMEAAANIAYAAEVNRVFGECMEIRGWKLVPDE